MKHAYHIEGMTCAGCAAKVEGLLAAVPEVTQVNVNLVEKKAEVVMRQHIPTQHLQKALEDTKYTLSEEVNQKIVLDTEAPVTLKTFLPIFLIFGLISTVTLIIQLRDGFFNLSEWMQHFMAGFFLVFSFFKLLDIPAFAMSYSSYDIVAKRVYAYGYIYPFIELALGISFLLPSLYVWSNAITLLVMGISVIGVIQSMLRNSKFQCACLGAVFNLPLSKITLFEDLLMIGMSLVSLLWMR